VGDEGAVCAIVRFAVGPVVGATRLIVFFSWSASACAVCVQHTRLVAQHEAGILVSDLDEVGCFRAVRQSKTSARGAHSRRRVRTHYLVHAVEAMNAKVGDQTAAVIPKPAIAADEAVLVERHFGRWPEIEVP